MVVSGIDAIGDAANRTEALNERRLNASIRGT
jgi:hypothetical protein